MFSFCFVKMLDIVDFRSKLYVIPLQILFQLMEVLRE